MWQSRTWWRDPRICRNCWTPWTQDKNPQAKFQKARMNTNSVSHNWRWTSQLCQKPEHDTVDKISARWILKSDGVSFALIVEPQAILRETIKHDSHPTFPSKDVPPLRWMTPLLQSQERRGFVANRIFNFSSFLCAASNFINSTTRGNAICDEHHDGMTIVPMRHQMRQMKNVNAKAAASRRQAFRFCKKQTKW